MNKTLTDGKLMIELEGRIDTNNVASVEPEIMEAIAGHEGNEICFDAGKLTYISSAGLRILMKVRKAIGKPVTVENVSRDVYDIFETTGFTQLLDVKKAYRTISTEGLPVIGTGFWGTVYRLDAETIVKMYRGKECIPLIENEKKMAQKAFLAGIPTAISYDIVQEGENYGSVFELLNARTFHDIVSEQSEPSEETVIKYTDLLKLVHGTQMKAGDFPSYKERFLEYLEVIKEDLAPGQYDGLKERLLAMPDATTVVHGDIQMKNVMQTEEGPMLIDMETIGLGDPVFELAGIFVCYQEFEEDDPDNSMMFLGMPEEKVTKIWNLILKHYFSDKTEEERQQDLKRIRLVAAIRFLYLHESTDLKNSELKSVRVAHTKEHIDTLFKTVDHLNIR